MVEATEYVSPFHVKGLFGVQGLCAVPYMKSDLKIERSDGRSSLKMQVLYKPSSSEFFYDGLWSSRVQQDSQLGVAKGSWESNCNVRGRPILILLKTPAKGSLMSRGLHFITHEPDVAYASERKR